MVLLGDTWLRTTTAWRNLTTGQATGRGTFAIIGDSLTYQAANGEANIRTALTGAGWDNADIYWYGVSGKGIDWRDSEGGLTVEEVADAKTQLGTVDTWVIALGTNGASTATPEAVQNVLDAINGMGHTYWFGTGNRDSSAQYAAFNAMAQPVVEAAGGTWLDYQTYAASIPTNRWNTDGLHMSPQGYDLRNAWMMQQIGA